VSYPSSYIFKNFEAKYCRNVERKKGAGPRGGKSCKKKEKKEKKKKREMKSKKEERKYIYLSKFYIWRFTIHLVIFLIILKRFKSGIFS
jgi:hypothetical protein